MLVSVLKLYSYGQVVEANLDQKRTIKIKVLEHLNSQYGLPNAEVDTETVDVEIFDGKIRTCNISYKDWIPANWLNRTANRISPPRVVVGQRVLIWRVGDSEQYYWEELDVDMRLKPREHIIIALNNENDGKELNLDNAYIIEWSTRDQRLRMRTNRNSGEKAAFEVDLNGAEGFLKLMDDVGCVGSPTYNGNGILIDSVNTILHMKNVKGTEYLLDNEDIIMKCNGNRTSTIGGTDTIKASKVIIDAPTNIKQATDLGDTLKVKGATTLQDKINGTVASWSMGCSG